MSNSYYSWRLALINCCFLPFIIAARLMINQSRNGGREEDKLINIEAGSVLSECVINTKTIYSFNFQQPAVDMYLNILSQAKTMFFKDSIIRGLLMGVGVFAIYCSNATIFHYSYVFIKEEILNFRI